MEGRIIGTICYLLCAAPFWVIARYQKDSKDPISFWAGDTSLKQRIKDIPAYNRDMARLYNRYGWAFAAAAVGGLLHPLLGVGIVVLNGTIGIFCVYRAYKKILEKYS